MSCLSSPAGNRRDTIRRSRSAGRSKSPSADSIPNRAARNRFSISGASTVLYLGDVSVMRSEELPGGVAHPENREDERRGFTATPSSAHGDEGLLGRERSEQVSLQRVEGEVFTHDFIFILKRCMVLNKVEAPICHTVQDTSVAATFPIGELLTSRRSGRSVSPGHISRWSDYRKRAKSPHNRAELDS